MSTLSIGDAAKSFGIGRTTLFKILRANEILNDYNVPYQPYLEAGYFEVKIAEICRNYTYHFKLHPMCLVTEKGLRYLHAFLSAKGYEVKNPFKL
jgi:phage antirepressor YoqD-like protein